MRVQAVRQKREAIEATATEDAWTQHIAEQSMLKAVDPGIEQRTAGTTGTIVSHHDTNSHDVAFETRMSDPVLNQEADPSVPPIAQANAEIAAGKAVAKPNPPHPVAPVQAAPAKQASPLGAPLAAPLAAVKAKPHPGAQPIRPANPRDGLLWADAMSVVADEMIAGLSALPPALRKQEAMRARLLRSTAMEITARAGRAPTPRQTVPLPKT
jgi:hypothetical protein